MMRKCRPKPLPSRVEGNLSCSCMTGTSEMNGVELFTIFRLKLHKNKLKYIWKLGNNRIRRHVLRKQRGTKHALQTDSQSTLNSLRNSDRAHRCGNKCVGKLWENYGQTRENRLPGQKLVSTDMLPNSLHVKKLECLIGIHPFNFCTLTYVTMWTVDSQYQSA